jgi:hypothetical protein
MVDIVHNGGSIMGNIGNVGKTIQRGLKKAGLKSVAKEVAKNAIKGAMIAGTAYMTGGNPNAMMMADAVGDPIASKAVSKIGLGLFSDIKKGVKKIGRNKHVKSAVREAKQVGKQVGKQMLNEFKNELKAEASHKLRNEIIPHALNKVDQYTGNTAYGDILANHADNMLSSHGMGLHAQPRAGRGLNTRGIVSKAKRKVGLGMAQSIESENSFGLGGKRLVNSPFIQGMDAKQRMAYARSHRKKKGGSMVPLGGSMLPLGNN